MGTIWLDIQNRWRLLSFRCLTSYYSDGKQSLKKCLYLSERQQDFQRKVWEDCTDNLDVTNVRNSRCKPWVATELILKDTGERDVKFSNDLYPIIPYVMLLFDMYQPPDLVWATAGGGRWIYFEASVASDFGLGFSSPERQYCWTNYPSPGTMVKLCALNNEGMTS